MSTIAFSFNDVTLPNIRGWGENQNSIVDSLNPIDTDGAVSNTGKLGGYSINIHGQIQGVDPDAVRTAWAAVLAALYDDDGGNAIANLEAFNDRYINCQVVNRAFSYSKRDAGMQTADYSIAFRADSAFWSALDSNSESESNMNSGDKLTVVAGHMGGAPCWPGAITISSATGLTADIVLTNNTTGAVWTFGANLAAGKLLVIDMEARTVTNDGVDARNDVDHPAADWWMLRGGVANEIQLDFAGGAVDAVMQFASRARYFNP